MTKTKVGICKNKWESSYKRNENFTLYPKEEVVKFLNRFVRKKVNINKYADILDFNKKVRGLDFGCGIGRQAILMREFGIEAYGMDISKVAIDMAKKLAKKMRYKDMVNRFSVISGKTIHFKDNFFDITISEAVLDSMNFDLSKLVIKEIERVTKNLVFISVISGNPCNKNINPNREKIVTTSHEKGTVQNYYTWAKIQELIRETNLKIKWYQLITEQSHMPKYIYGRHYVLLQK